MRILDNTVKILTISGSLRERSSNTNILRAITNLAPKNVTFDFYNELSELPHFNPEIDNDEFPPAPIKALRKRLKEANGVLFSTPEYAKGVPGALKNALDWLVSSGELMNKPVSIISASPSPLGGEQAYASLLLTLDMLNAEIVKGATMKIPFIGTKLNADAKITDPSLEQDLKYLITTFVNTIHKY
ncbi:flavoprotein [Aneurinibacillus migulanus]|uniref:NADPH-dependent FMN reductase n=1 Tax=Aneurinibacillus migulanus TaxID=47500 RepID=UPI0005B89EE7|nr:NAD(P)H-dependent oxidoreductase [Aneurinibacillus migulanus]KIV55085.1 flavoprotein [Aneurinibacillus migulanus]KPD06143.1 flavoprotein [Aneurinibacillus migulanus]MCP1355489.1 NAD(P)H-dependent oxidoreductase [Aneurinibacillus migulanus]MED4729458.1 NAD(P)H-dependent oxidoreductase [Aneurinibacillus migulanus]CEH29500.1 Nadph-dependent fmn reductase [Aneurinibacillus migulanus]